MTRNSDKGTSLIARGEGKAGTWALFRRSDVPLPTLSDGRGVRIRIRTPSGDWATASSMTKAQVDKVGEAMAKAGKATGAFRRAASEQESDKRSGKRRAEF